MIRGIDVSHYQKSVDWAGLKAKHGLDFGAAKCGEGTSFVDSYFPTNWKRMKAAGLRRIAYWYATPSASSAKAQAGKLVALSDPQHGDALCLDLEKSSLSQDQTNAWMRAFGDALRSLAPGVTTIAYLGGYAANGSGRQAVDHFDHWWYPRYASMNLTSKWPTTFSPNVAKPNTTGFVAPRSPSIWQWSPNLGGLDANVSDLTIPQLFDQEDSMAFSLDDIAHAVWAYDQNGARQQAWAYIQTAAGTPATPAQIADAVIAALPPAATGGLTKDDVRAALVDVFTHGTGGTS